MEDSQFAAGVMPDSLAISALRADSAARKLAKAAAVSVTGSAPSAVSFWTSSGCFEAVCTAALICVTRSGGMSLGPQRAYQSTKVSPENPASAMVGTDG